MFLAPWVCGLDIGQAHDPAALAIVQRDMVLQPGGLIELRYQCRHLERFPLGTPYGGLCLHQVPPGLACRHCPAGVSIGGLVEQVAARVVRLPRPREWPVDLGHEPYRLLVDATGVGRPIVELFAQAHLRPIAVTMTWGEDVHQHAWNDYTVPKKVLVGALQVTLQTGRCRVAAALPEAQTLVKEALNFQYKLSPTTGTDQYGAWREGQHDDLLFALGLCTWYGEHHRPARWTDPQRAQTYDAGRPLGQGRQYAATRPLGR